MCASAGQALRLLRMRWLIAAIHALSVTTAPKAHMKSYHAQLADTARKNGLSLPTSASSAKSVTIKTSRVRKDARGAARHRRLRKTEGPQHVSAPVSVETSSRVSEPASVARATDRRMALITLTVQRTAKRMSSPCAPLDKPSQSKATACRRKTMRRSIAVATARAAAQSCRARACANATRSMTRTRFAILCVRKRSRSP